MKRTISLAIALLVILTCIAVGPVYADGGIYVVCPGDTLLGIAARHGLTATQLASANGLRWNAWVYVGQRLMIPGATPTTTTSATGGTYTVRPGDTLIGIAARHGISVSQLAAANGMGANAWVYVGQRLTITGAASAAPSASTASTTSSSSGQYIVRPGDTLISIAARHRLTVAQLAQANGMYTNSWVYTGQRLTIPGSAASSPTNTSPSTPSTTPTTSAGGTYTVRPGDTLIGIAARHGVSVSRLAAANGLRVNSWVYTGQRLSIPGAGSTPAASAAPAAAQGGSGKWIDVNLSTQTVTAYSGQTAVFQTSASTGTWRTPTVVGTFSIYAKYTSTAMSGPGYYLPNVPYAMFFYRGYSLHGTYWHNNFGTPMSHGCVNLPTSAAQWIFNWAPVGTKVVSHY
jgi:LysM repeat protein